MGDFFIRMQFSEFRVQRKTTPTPGPAEIVNFRGWVPGGELSPFLISYHL